MEGRGEKVTPLSAADGARLPDPSSIVLFTPPIFAATAAVYREFCETDRGRGPNDLQPAAIRLYPGIGEAIRRLEGQGLARVTMSGSGSTVYGIRS
jgi:4-diphosphocytidyl-2C-methyl-D-erythritol kinase